MNIFNFKSYKEYLKAYVKNLPKGGRGELTKISQALNIHNTTLSQVLKGSKNINLEQGIELGSYLSLNENEKNYLLLLINFEKAGSHKLKKHLFSQIEEEIKRSSSELFFQEASNQEFSSEIKGKFYSFWGYSGIRILSSIDKYNSLETISKKAGLTKKRTKEILDFLVKNGLCKIEKNKYIVGPLHTHITPQDTFINSHRLNWRAKTIERLGSTEESELIFSAPMSLSSEDFIYVRSELNKLIKNVINTAKNSKAEKAACLNIDWIEF